MKALRIASYNVHRCVGTDRKHDPDRVAAVIEEMRPDIIGLQEVDARYHIEHGIDQLDYLAERTGFHSVAGPTLRHHTGYYGNGVLSRLPIAAVRHLDLSVIGREPRAALDIDATAGDHTVRFIVTHFGLGHGERRRQLRTILTLLAAQERRFTFLVGDFNEWMPASNLIRRLDQELGASVALRTFPSFRPVLRLDRIWAQPRASLRAAVSHSSPLARRASDHLPILAEIALE